MLSEFVVVGSQATTTGASKKPDVANVCETIPEMIYRAPNSTDATKSPADNLSDISDDIALRLHRINAYTFQIITDKIDFGIVNAITHILRSATDVSTASCREIHPLSYQAEIIVVMSSECRPFVNVFKEALSKMSAKLHDEASYILKGEMLDQTENAKGTRPARARLILPSAHYSWGNMIRRALLTSVPVMAIGKVSFRRNTSILIDQVLAERLRLLPIRYGAGATLLNIRDPVVACLSLNINVPSDSKTTVTTLNSKHCISSANDVSVAFSNGHGFPIVNLAPNQGVDLLTHIEIGTAKRHIRFSAVSSVTFLFDENNESCEMNFKCNGQLTPRAVVRSAIKSVVDCIVSIREAAHKWG